MESRDRLIIALDVDTKEKALALVDKLKSEVRFFKVGFELFSSYGPDIVKNVKDKGCEVFLDLKFHDIPNTVAKAAVSVTKLGAFMFNLHALGGYEMMKMTANAIKLEAKRLGVEKPKILAVTALTSMDENGLKKIGINDNIQGLVLRLASLAKEAGMDGVVASPQEAKAIRENLGKDFLIVTPGVRPKSAAAGDQKRVATPKGAIENGADFIVVGRPIIEAKDPLTAVRDILKELD